MKVLVACEESQAVTKEFRALGHEAFSCDILPCSGGHPEWHLQQDVIPFLKENWDLIIAFPPCTYLSVAGNAWLNVEKYGEAAIKRKQLQKEAAEFFMEFINAHCKRVAVENPVGYMNGNYRKPDQIINPYLFGDADRKRTCLWLKGLPLLKPTNIVEPAQPTYIDKSGKKRYFVDAMSQGPERAKLRSKTFPRIAKAMASQWGI